MLLVGLGGVQFSSCVVCSLLFQCALCVIGCLALVRSVLFVARCALPFF